jgi:hypothetical protein
MSNINELPLSALYDRLVDATEALLDARKKKARQNEIDKIEAQIELLIKSI